jgi:acyl dehydratase
MSAARTRRVTMSQELIDSWADLTTDYNPLHVSPEYAATTQFGGTIAHGHYTLSLMEELMLSIAGAEWLHGGLLHKVRFRAPVRPGETYVLTAIEDTAMPSTWRLELRDDSGEILAAEAEAELGKPALWTA